MEELKITRERAIRRMEWILKHEIYCSDKLSHAAINMAITALRSAEPENKPLTLEELPCFEPIYVVPIGSSVGEWSAHWCIYQIDNATAKSDTHKGRMWFLYDTDYGKTWIAYARKPEGSEKP